MNTILRKTLKTKKNAMTKNDDEKFAKSTKFDTKKI